MEIDKKFYSLPVLYQCPSTTSPIPTTPKPFAHCCFRQQQVPNPRSHSCPAIPYPHPLQNESPNSPTSAPAPQSQDRCAFSWEPVTSFIVADMTRICSSRRSSAGPEEGERSRDFVADGTTVIVQKAPNVGVARTPRRHTFKPFVGSYRRYDAYLRP